MAAGWQERLKNLESRFSEWRSNWSSGHPISKSLDQQWLIEVHGTIRTVHASIHIIWVNPMSLGEAPGSLRIRWSGWIAENMPGISRMPLNCGEYLIDDRIVYQPVYRQHWLGGQTWRYQLRTASTRQGVTSTTWCYSALLGTTLHYSIPLSTTIGCKSSKTVRPVPGLSGDDRSIPNFPAKWDRR